MKATKPRGDQSGLPLKKPRCRFSLHTIPHVSQTLGKLDESQFPICNSVESERPPTHAFVSTAVGHLPRTKTNHATVVLFLVDKQVLRGAKNFVDSLVAVFADIGNTFKVGSYFLLVKVKRKQSCGQEQKHRHLGQRRFWRIENPLSNARGRDARKRR